jgi:L-threonylcarbamoyladenylate synthase
VLMRLAKELGTIPMTDAFGAQHRVWHDMKQTPLESPMLTEVVVVDPVHPEDADLWPAVELLRAGKLVAFPTETVYGLGANALDPEAVRAIFTAKGRPADNPLIIHIAHPQDLTLLAVQIPPCATPLIDRFMPGPLTLVLQRSPIVSDAVTAGLDTVAVRIPEHPVARRLIELAGIPIAAPSANRSGRPSPTTAAHVLEDLAGLIPMIVDGGTCDFGLESTVLDITGPIPVILRPGAVSAEDIIATIGPIQNFDSLGSAASISAPRSPGMKYRHYAPKTPLQIAEGKDQKSRSQQVVNLVREAIHNGLTPALFIANETAGLVAENLPTGYRKIDLNLAEPNQFACGTLDEQPRPVLIISYGPSGQARLASNQLFAALRLLDDCASDLIIAESMDVVGIGAAYVNRLRKAAGGGEPLAEIARAKA